MPFPPVPEQLDAIRQGALEIVPEDELARKLERSAAADRPLVVKQGFDPTRPDLHIGHAVSIRKLRTFQELGHQVVFVVGDSTALIGDPSGRNELRPPLSEEEVRANARTYTDQVFKLLDPERTRIEFNSSWLAPLRLAELLRLTAQYTVARMLEREDFARRHAENRPISLVEFMYPLMQAYDSVALSADVELGGSDQKFNLLVARAIQERYGQAPQVCLLMPLLRGADGRKMSKSYDNYVGLADPPGEQYGRTLSISDDLLEEWWTLASGAAGAELEEGLRLARTDPYRAKRLLAARVVAAYHGGDAAGRAAEEFDALFRRHELPAEMPEHEVDPGDPALLPEGGTVLVARLLARVGLASSNSDAVRQVEQGAVAVDGEKVAGREARVAAAGEVVLQRGKRHFARVRFRPSA
ncbi:MAG TPA: tyrosine--tRNA ligase, partial [Longimicrobiaceae bacterium]|nr:tyrosine--tRNA ligase [Longimicrobiaceae bacterium]